MIIKKQKEILDKNMSITDTGIEYIKRKNKTQVKNKRS